MPVRSHLKKKRKAYRFGWWAEAVALLYYIAHGYLPVAWRYKTRMGEVDLIVASRRRIIFVEVKARKGNTAMFPLHPKQLERIRNTALLFVAKNSRFAKVEWQVDLLLVAPWGLPRRLKNVG